MLKLGAKCTIGDWNKMIINRDHDQTMQQLMEAYRNLLQRINDTQEECTKNNDTSPETRGHKTYKLVRYWFDHYGQLPKE